MKKRRFTILLSAAGLGFAAWAGRTELSIVLVTAALALPLGYALGALIDEWRRIAAPRTLNAGKDDYGWLGEDPRGKMAPNPFEENWQDDPGGAKAMADESTSASLSLTAHGYNPLRPSGPH